MLYQKYQHIENIELFIERASVLFPTLNCGIASVYLEYVLGTGRVVQGKFNTHHHTFLFIDGITVVDITADQYAGPVIYIGPLNVPRTI